MRHTCSLRSAGVRRYSTGARGAKKESDDHGSQMAPSASIADSVWFQVQENPLFLAGFTWG